ncbi:site-specific integrase [Amycolatopsis sp. VC5-11]|uniref:site-specific integrase n=1 Tax=Amycolatopsis sp. VC5-11 TaxID=3120156 RepID=UPI00300AB68A
MTAGGISRHCRCRDENGKDLGARCPKLRNRKHGVWKLNLELPAGPDGKRRAFRRSGYAVKTAAAGALEPGAQDDLDRARELLNLAQDEVDTEKVVELLLSLGRGEPLPSTDSVRTLLAASLSLTDKATVADYLRAWLPTIGVRRATRVLYEGHIDNYLVPKIGKRPKNRLSVAHLTEMLAEIEDDNERIRQNNADRTFLTQLIRETPSRAKKRELREQLAALPPYRRTVGKSTQQRIIATLRKAYNDGMNPQQGLTFNPATHVKVSAKKHKPMVWTPARVEKWRETGLRPGPVMVWMPEHAGVFLDYVEVEAPEQLPMWHLFLYRGPRRGEVAGLSWTEVHDATSEVEILTQLTEVAYEVEEGEPKSEESNRRFGMDATGMQLLREHRVRQTRERLRLGPAWVDSGRVFTRPDGSALRPSWIGDEFARHVEAAGLPPVRLHDLRHVAATLMLLADVSMKVVQETLGHASIALTSDVYSSVLPQMSQAAAEAAVSVVPRRGASAQPARNPGTEPTDLNARRTS